MTPMQAIRAATVVERRTDRCRRTNWDGSLPGYLADIIAVPAAICPGISQPHSTSGSS